MVKFKRAKVAQPGIDLTPIVDMVFILLIFFLLSSAFLKPAINLNLPVAAYRDSSVGNIVVAVTRDKKLFVNQTPIQLAQLKEKVTALLKASPSSNVVFSADKGIDYGFFVTVMDSVKSAGAKTISLEHEIPR